MAEERGRKGGTSFPNKPDTQTRTARPTSVGPHHVTREQEDPANPGITPEKGYASEIAANNEATSRGPGSGPVAPTPKAAAKTGRPEEAKHDTTEDAPVQPLSGTTRMQKE
ncbi:hypothetical protein [Falsiroseomonas sp. HW251]|uniref:hypothetical protein n=1 Tax=Falsiroseomonas sp. HW251 TaxID=3390998 RepID=UPI003D3221EC